MNIITFGKYKGMSVTGVLRINPSYFGWCKNNVRGFRFSKRDYEIYLEWLSLQQNYLQFTGYSDNMGNIRFLFRKVEEAKNNSMSDKNFVAALTDVLRYFRDNGELKKAYEIQKDSLTNMANSPWAKLVIGMFTSKVQEDKVDVELPDIDALIKENTSDEFIERKINDILGIKEK